MGHHFWTSTNWACIWNNLPLLGLLLDLIVIALEKWKKNGTIDWNHWHRHIINILACCMLYKNDMSLPFRMLNDTGLPAIIVSITLENNVIQISRGYFTLGGGWLKLYFLLSLSIILYPENLRAPCIGWDGFELIAACRKFGSAIF